MRTLTVSRALRAQVINGPYGATSPSSPWVPGEYRTFYIRAVPLSVCTKLPWSWGGLGKNKQPVFFPLKMQFYCSNQHWLIFTSGTASVLTKLRMVLRWHFPALQWSLGTHTTLERSLMRVWPSPHGNTAWLHAPCLGTPCQQGFPAQGHWKLPLFSLLTKGLPLPKGLK